MLPNPWILLAVLVALIATGGGAYSYGHRAGAETERIEWQLAVADQKKMAADLISQAKDKVIQTERRNTAETLRLQSELTAKQKELENANTRDRAAVDADGGLRDPGAARRWASGGDGPAAGSAGSGPASGEASGVLSGEAQEFLWAYAADADELNAAYQTCLEDLARRIAGN